MMCKFNQLQFACARASAQREIERGAGMREAIPFIHLSACVIGLGSLARDTSNMNIPNIEVPLAQMKRRRKAYILSILLERARPQVSETHTHILLHSCL